MSFDKLERDKETLWAMSRLTDDDIEQLSPNQLDDYIRRCHEARDGDLRHSTSIITNKLRNRALDVIDKLVDAYDNHPQVKKKATKAAEEAEKRKPQDYQNAVAKLETLTAKKTLCKIPKIYLIGYL